MTEIVMEIEALLPNLGSLQTCGRVVKAHTGLDYGLEDRSHCPNAIVDDARSILFVKAIQPLFTVTLGDFASLLGLKT